jgi:Sigma-70, non-essential region
VAVLLDLDLVPGDEALPAFCAQFGRAVEPARIELKPKVVETFDNIADAYKRLRRLQDQDIQNKLRNDSLSPAQERRYKKLKDDIISEVKSLRLNQARIDALVEQLYDINKRLVGYEGRLMRLAESHGVAREDFLRNYQGSELGLDGGERERVLHIVVVEIAFAGRGLNALAFLAVGAFGRTLERGRARGRGRRRRRLRQHGGAGSRRAPRAASRSAGRPVRSPAPAWPWRRGRHRSLRDR